MEAATCGWLSFDVAIIRYEILGALLSACSPKGRRRYGAPIWDRCSSGAGGRTGRRGRRDVMLSLMAKIAAADEGESAPTPPLN
jgi:hypothetical protein